VSAVTSRRVVVDQASWGQLRVTGGDRVRFVQGMVTNDVVGLAPGAACRASLLNVKGRVLAVVEVVNEGEALVVLSEPETTDKVRQLLEKHAIVDDVTFEPIVRPLHRVWEDPASVWTAPPSFSEPPAGAVAWGSPEAEVRRIEAMLPRYGVDVSEDYFPFEAHLDAAISYTKGCYIGQEVVARANARGHANKRLVQLRLDGEGPVAPGTKLSAEVREDAGVVTSSAVSPSLGPLALAYVHKTAWDPGTRLQVGERTGTVV
jgi:folate-binding protein YgfZ